MTIGKTGNSTGVALFERVVEFLTATSEAVPTLREPLLATGRHELESLLSTERRRVLLACDLHTFQPMRAAPLRFQEVDHASTWLAIATNLAINAAGFEEFFEPTESEVDQFRPSLVGCFALTAFEGEVPVGAGMITAAVAGVAELCGVAVPPPHRRRGVGGRLSGELVRRALERGVESVVLSTSEPHALHIYQRLGFRPCLVELSEGP